MSVTELTDNRSNTLWERADGEKIFTSFSPNQMLKIFSGHELLRSARDWPASSQPVNVANEQIRSDQLHRFSSIDTLIDSLTT